MTKSLFRLPSKYFTALLLAGIGILPISPAFLQIVNAAPAVVDQSVEVCFVAIDYEQKPLTKLPGNTAINLNLYTKAHLQKNKVNNYGSESIPLSWNSSVSTNKKLDIDKASKKAGNKQVDAYCKTYSFKNPTDHEYTYDRAVITSDLDWQETRYNDEVGIKFVDPDIAFPYSGEWFDNILGNEDQRNANVDGHITMTPERLHRRLIVVAQLDQNLPDYAVAFGDAVVTSFEYTLSTLPNEFDVNSLVQLRFSVQNLGKMTWASSNNPQALTQGTLKPVNVSYHWKNLDTGEYTQYEGRRALLNQDVAYTRNDSNIALSIQTPSQPGRYELILDLVHEGVTWFSKAGASTRTFDVSIGVSPEATVVPKINQPGLDATDLTGQAATYYIVQSPRPWDQSWRCAGFDCYVAIAEQFYNCKARGIPNFAYGMDESVLKGMCWWPIYNANRSLPVPFEFTSNPWNYLLPGWQLVIPLDPWNGGVPPITPDPLPADNFIGIPGASVADPYAGMNGAHSPWPQVTFDRFIAWDGSWKSDQIKWSETTRPNAPTITSLNTNSANGTVTVYGVAIPKHHPVNVRVWNEYRYCWACGSGWDFHYQQATAQHVKIALFKEDGWGNWQYLGHTWNDDPSGRWHLTLPLGSDPDSIGTGLNPGDRVFAEVQVEADYWFNDLKWWVNTTEAVNFNLRDTKYFGYPYFASGRGNLSIVPEVIVDNRSAIEIAIDDRAVGIGATAGGLLTSICGLPGKYYSNLRNSQAGAIVYVNNRTVYSWGGTWDTYQYYGDRCDRFGVPTDDPHDGGVGPFNTAGAFQDFTNGRMYWSFKHLGKFTYGTISNKYEQAGGTNSSYGWPVSEVYALNENGVSTNCQNFEGGAICESDYQPELQIELEDFTGVEDEEILIEPDIGGSIVEVLKILSKEMNEFIPPSSDLFIQFGNLAKQAQLVTHFLFGATRGFFKSINEVITFLKEISLDGKLPEVVEGLKSLIEDPKLIAYIIQEQIETFIRKPFLEKVEMLGEMAVNVVLIAAAGYGLAKGAINLLSKGSAALKQAVIAGQFGEKVVDTVVGGIRFGVQLGKNGLVRLKDLGKQLANLPIEESTKFIQNLDLATSQEKYLYHIQRFSHVLRGEFTAAGVFKSGMHHFQSLVDAARSGKLTYSILRISPNGVREVLVNGSKLKTFFPDWFTVADIDTAMKIFPKLSKQVGSGSVREMVYKGLTIRGYVDSKLQISDTIFPIFIP